MDNDFAHLAEKEVYPSPFESKMQNLQYRDLFYTKIPRSLRFNDRISMLYGTELREPFLDYRLVELAFAQNEDVKYKDGNSKWLLRQISQELISNKIALAPKRALQTPQREWIANDLKEYANAKVQHFATLDFVNKNEVNKIWNEYLNGNKDNSFYIWQWINSVELL